MGATDLLFSSDSWILVSYKKYIGIYNCSV